MEEYKQLYREASNNLISNIKILSGGTLVLLFSFTQNISGYVYSKDLFFKGEILMIISLFLSSIVSPYLASKISRKYSWGAKNEDVANLAKIQRFVFNGSALFYFLGIVVLTLFVNRNIFPNPFN